MKKISKFIIVGMLFLLGNHGFAQESGGWVFIAEGISGDRLYVKDIQELSSRNNDEFGMWVKFVKAPTKYKNKQGKWSTKENGYNLQYVEIDCEQKEFSGYDYVVYDAKKTLISSGNHDGNTRKITPNSITESVYEYVCLRIEEVVED